MLPSITRKHPRLFQAHTHTHRYKHTHTHTHALLLLGCWRCFHRFDEFLADALSLPAECVAASPPPPPLRLSPLSTQSLHPSVLRPGAGGGRSAPRSVLWVLSASPLVPLPLHTHAFVFGHQRRPLIYYTSPLNLQCGSQFCNVQQLHH